MAAGRLTQHRVDTFKPGRRSRDIRGRDPGGFGVRILPSDGWRYAYPASLRALMIRHTPWNNQATSSINPENTMNASRSGM